MIKEQVYKDMIGTAAAPTALTSSYAGSGTVFLVRHTPNVQLNAEFTPGAVGNYFVLLVETSNDNGTTWNTYSILENTATQVKVYSEGGVLSTADGIPFSVPGDLGAAAVTRPFWNLTIVADYMRVSAKENLGAPNGTLHVRATAAS